MDSTTPPPPELRSPPIQGILSRTLCSSPAVRWILPARIRSPSKNDLVFVGDSAVHLREFVPADEPYLSDSVCSINFDTRILAAHVISATINIVAVSTDDQILQQKQTVEEESFSSNGRPIRDGEPAQILILSNSRSEIILLYACEDFEGNVHFVHATKSLLTGLTATDQQVLHLARDPESRALAFAPKQGLVTVCSLPSLDHLKGEIDRWQPARGSLKPFREQRLIQVDGDILHMDFLQPLKEDRNKVILVLIIAKLDRTYLVLYRWDDQQPLHRIRAMRSSGQKVPETDEGPAMLIPCNAPASFLLVTDAGLVLYDWVTHSEARRTAYPFSDRNQLMTGHPARQWTQWARPRRHETHRRRADEIMLVREDGALLLYDIDVQSAIRVKLTWSAGTLDMKMQKALCLLPAPLQIEGGDILIACGADEDGGVFHLRAREQVRRIQSIPNGTPFNDLLLLPPTPPREARIDQNSRIFACCGSTQVAGGLAEICHGIEADIRTEVQDDGFSSILRIWTMAKASNQVLLLSAHPLETSLFTLDTVTMELFQESADILPGTDLDVPSLAAIAMGDDRIVQVTTKGINVVPLMGQFQPVHHKFDGVSLPVCADIEASTGCVFVVHQEHELSYLKVYAVTSASPSTVDVIGQSPTLHARPSCMCVSPFGDRVTAVFASDSGDLQVAVITGESVLLGEPIRLSEVLEDLSHGSIGSMSILTKPQIPVSLLLCGMRNGYVLGLESRYLDDPDLFSGFRVVLRRRLARTSINVTPDEFVRQSGCVEAAFIAHGDILERIALKLNHSGADLECTRVVFPSHHATGSDLTSRETINAVSRVPHMGYNRGGDTAGLLLCAKSTSISAASLSSQSKSISRYIEVPGIARKLIHSKFLRSLVVGVNPIPSTTATTETTIPPVATDRPLLCFASLHDDEAPLSPIDHSKTVKLGEPGEKISALTHYSPTDGRSHFEMVIVALQSATKIADKKFRISSRILCVSDKHVAKIGAAPAVARSVIRMPHKRITALCPIGKSGLLIGCSNELLLHNLDVGTKKWSTLTRHALPSAAHQIKVQGSLIYVATEKHSLLVLREHDGRLSIQNSDTRARTVSNVLPLHRGHIIIADSTGTETQLTGIIEGTPQRGAVLQRSFEINLPHPLERLELDRATISDGPLSSNHPARRDAFLGSFPTGQIYRFITLSESEWLLCHFLQGLSKPGMKIGAKVVSQELDMSLWLAGHGAEGKKGRLSLPPRMMGVDGDLLGRLIETRGKYTLPVLLGLDEDRGLRIKLEKNDKEDVRMAETSPPRLVLAAAAAAAAAAAGDLQTVRNEDETAAVQARLATLSKLLRNALQRDVREEDIVGTTVIWLRGLLSS